MSARNLLSTLLASVLVLNASCACAAVEVDPGQNPHAHHQQTVAEPAEDGCLHPDCAESCAQAGTSSERESVNLPTFKPDLDWDDLSGALARYFSFDHRTTSTGPPGNPPIFRAGNPVRRFDLQLK